MNFKKMCLAALVAAGVGVSSQIANADVVSALGLTEGFNVNANVNGTNSAKIDGADSELSTRTYNISAGAKWWTLSYTRTDYDFSNVYFDPFDSLNKISLDLRYSTNINSNINASFGLGLGALYESDLDLGKSYNIVPRATVGWNFDNGMTAYFGVAANVNKVENIFLPVLGLKLGEDRDVGFTGAIGYPATFVQYRLNQNWAFNTTFITVRDVYHLDGETSTSIDDGYFREDSYGLSAGATFSFQKIKVSGGVFSYFDRKFKFYDDSGNEFASFDTDPSVGLYLRTAFVF